MIERRSKMIKMKFAAYLKFLIDWGINFSSIAIRKITRFLSALVYLVVTELIPSVSYF